MIYQVQWICLPLMLFITWTALQILLLSLDVLIMSFVPNLSYSKTLCVGVSPHIIVPFPNFIQEHSNYPCRLHLYILPHSRSRIWSKLKPKKNYVHNNRTSIECNVMRIPFPLLFMRAHNSKLTHFLQSAFFNPFLEPNPHGSDYHEGKEISHQSGLEAATNWRWIRSKSKIFSI